MVPFTKSRLGIFKGNQAQVDEYMAILNPLLRRTTEGKPSILAFICELGTTLANEDDLGR